MIGYKIVTRTEQGFTSFMDHEMFTLPYALNVPTVRQEGCGPLALFHTMSDALDYIDGYAQWNPGKAAILTVNFEPSSDVDLWYADEFRNLPLGAVLLDVRGPSEFSDWHIPSAVNLPVGQLRAKHATLDKSRTYYIYCKVGLRSYLAYRILKQLGFQVKTLSGGTDFFCACFPEPEHGGRNSATPQDAGNLPQGSQSSPLQVETKNEEPGTTNMHAPCNCPSPSTAKTIMLDCMGLQCPGPMMRLKETIAVAAVGDGVRDRDHARLTVSGELLFHGKTQTGCGGARKREHGAVEAGCIGR